MNTVKTERENTAKTPQKNRHTNQRVLDLTYTAMFTALITICSQITIPTGKIEFTLQTFAVFLAGAMLGWKRGTLSVLVYILLGAVGVPVFAEWSGGLGALFGMTGGYIIGFLFTGLIVGLMCDKFGKKLWVLIVSMVIGLLVCYAFGTVWFMIVYTQQVKAIGIMEALGLCVFPFLLFDGAKIAAATVLVNRLDKVVKL